MQLTDENLFDSVRSVESQYKESWVVKATNEALANQQSFDLLSASEESEISPLNHDGQESTVNEEGASTVATPVYHEAATEEPQEEYYGINDVSAYRHSGCSSTGK
jgi:hypothetical protein